MITSVFTGVVFFRVREVPNQLDMNLMRGVFFISIMNLTLLNLGQLPGLLDDRTIYYKQQGAHFYRPQSFLIAKILGAVPFSIAEVCFWYLLEFWQVQQTYKSLTNVVSVQVNLFCKASSIHKLCHHHRTYHVLCLPFSSLNCSFVRGFS